MSWWRRKQVYISVMMSQRMENKFIDTTAHSKLAGEVKSATALIPNPSISYVDERERQATLWHQVVKWVASSKWLMYSYHH